MTNIKSAEEKKNEINKFYSFVYITTNMVNEKKYIGQKKYYGNYKNYLESGVVYFWQIIRQYYSLIDEKCSQLLKLQEFYVTMEGIELNV